MIPELEVEPAGNGNQYNFHLIHGNVLAYAGAQASLVSQEALRLEVLDVIKNSGIVVDSMCGNSKDVILDWISLAFVLDFCQVYRGLANQHPDTEHAQCLMDDRSGIIQILDQCWVMVKQRLGSLKVLVKYSVVFLSQLSENIGKRSQEHEHVLRQFARDKVRAGAR